MIYILIVMWFGNGTGTSGKAALSVEFNNLESCQAAASSIRRQLSDRTIIGALVCAAKGKP